MWWVKSRADKYLERSEFRSEFRDFRTSREPREHASTRITKSNTKYHTEDFFLNIRKAKYHTKQTLWIHFDNIKYYLFSSRCWVNHKLNLVNRTCFGFGFEFVTERFGWSFPTEMEMGCWLARLRDDRSSEGYSLRRWIWNVGIIVGRTTMRLVE